VKTLEERVGACSLTHSTLGVERLARAPGWGLGRLKINLITHTNLHKPNNKLVSAYLEHFWCTNEPWANIDTRLTTAPQPRFEGSHHLSPL